MACRVSMVAAVVAAALAAGCTPEDRDPVLVGGDGDADGDGDMGSGDAIECDRILYPCGPFGRQNCDVMADLSFIPANDAARATAGEDGFFDLHDIFADESVTGIMLYGTAEWCTACIAESNALNDLYAEYQDIDGSGNRIEFVTVVFQDIDAHPATVEVAERYGEHYDFVFPTVADTSGDVLYYFDAASTPANIFIDATSMQIYTIVQGFVPSMMRASMNALDGEAECRTEP